MKGTTRELNETYLAEPGAVPAARAALSAFAGAAGADQDQIEAIRLAGSEAISNAVLHAYPDASGSVYVYVTAAIVTGGLWVLVADDGCGLTPRVDRPGLGLGLGLMAQLSDELEIVTRAAGGTEVRMRFDLVPAEPGERQAAPRSRRMRTVREPRR